MAVSILHRYPRFTAGAALLLLLEQFVLCTGLPAQVSQPIPAIEMVNQMVQAETAAWRNREHFLYENEERSTRTNGRLWEELVVETPDGSLPRLIAEDGKPLSSSRQKEEDKRIAYLGKPSERLPSRQAAS